MDKISNEAVLSDGTPRPFFRIKEATHGVTIVLPSKAKLIVAKSPSSYFIGAEWEGVQNKLALSHDATEHLLSALIRLRGSEEPLPLVEVFPCDFKEGEKQTA